MEVKDFPNYLIFRNGAVLSKKRKKFLKPHYNGSGYYQYDLRNNGKKGHPYAHRLVALHYISNPHNYKEVDHINRIKTDNRVSNLRWVTKNENMQNIGNYKTNTSGHKNISFYKGCDKWVFEKQKNKKLIRKCFNTLEEAIEFKQTNLFDSP
jgi:hypothetical protein